MTTNEEHMGSTPSGETGSLRTELVTPQDMEVARGSQGCALERDWI